MPLALPQALYGLYRMAYLWDSFSNWHMVGFGLTSTIYAIIYFMFSKSAKPTYAPLAEGGGLISGGTDLDQKGVIECARPAHARTRARFYRCGPWLAAARTRPAAGHARCRYCWDMLYTSMFVQLGSGFVSDLFWLVYLIPPSVGFYYLWVKVIYPWISKPDEEPEPMPEKKQKVKYGKGR